LRERHASEVEPVVLVMVPTPGWASVLQLVCALLVATSCLAKTAVESGNLLVSYTKEQKHTVRQHIIYHGYEIIRDAELAGVFTVRRKNASMPLDGTVKQVCCGQGDTFAHACITISLPLIIGSSRV
jgi:hypothetical protein